MDILQTIVWLILIEAFLLAAAVLFSHFRRCKLASLTIAIMILLPSALAGCIAGVKASHAIAPHIAFGAERVRLENIKVTGFEDGKYVFSNGEKIRLSDSHVLRINFGFSFLLGLAVIFFPGLYIAKRITRRFAPDVYDLLENRQKNRMGIAGSTKKFL